MAWTEERIALLTKLWTDGHTASQIALALGEATTRNAVIGKAHRLGLSGRPAPVRAPRPATSRPSRPKSLMGGNPSRGNGPRAGRPAGQAPDIRTRQALARVMEQPRPAPRIIDVPLGPGVSLLKVTDKMCKWPIGHPGDENFRFCGNAAHESSPYCEGHAQMAYQPMPSKRDRRAG